MLAWVSIIAIIIKYFDVFRQNNIVKITGSELGKLCPLMQICSDASNFDAETKIQDTSSLGLHGGRGNPL